MGHKLTVIKGASMDDVMFQLQRLVRESLYDPDVISLAVMAASSNPDDIVGIHSFVRSTFPYKDNPTIIEDRYGLTLKYESELFTAPWLYAREYFNGNIMAADCDDSGMLIAALNAVTGYQVRLLLVDVSGDGDIDHLLSEVFHPIHNRWLVVDATTNSPVLWDEVYYKKMVVEI